MSDDPFLTIRQLTKWLPFHTGTFYRKIREGNFPPGIKIGENRRAWRRSDIESWIKEQEGKHPLKKSFDKNPKEPPPKGSK